MKILLLGLNGSGRSHFLAVLACLAEGGGTSASVAGLHLDAREDRVKIRTLRNCILKYGQLLLPYFHLFWKEEVFSLSVRYWGRPFHFVRVPEKVFHEGSEQRFFAGASGVLFFVDGIPFFLNPQEGTDSTGMGSSFSLLSPHQQIRKIDDIFSCTTDYMRQSQGSSSDGWPYALVFSKCDAYPKGEIPYQKGESLKPAFVRAGRELVSFVLRSRACCPEGKVIYCSSLGGSPDGGRIKELRPVGFRPILDFLHKHAREMKR